MRTYKTNKEYYEISIFFDNALVEEILKSMITMSIRVGSVMSVFTPKLRTEPISRFL